MPEDDTLRVHWFPGHMTKALRAMEQDVRMVDAVCELADARIPVSSRNPELARVLGDKPRLLLLNRADQADPEATKRWVRRYRGEGLEVLETDSKSGRGVAQFPAAVRRLLKDRLAQYAAKGQAGRPLRVMVAGIPNVGKSTFINRVSGRKAAAASDRPGVTRGKQWVTVDKGLELLDTPGVLWPRFDDAATGERLAFTGAVKDAVLDAEALAARLLDVLKLNYPAILEARYKLTEPGAQPGWALLEAAARKRGFLVSGGEADTLRMANILLDEFRGGVLGRVTLEAP